MSIHNQIDDDDIDKFAHGGPITQKINFNLTFSTKNGIDLAINCDFDDKLCVGMYREDGKWTKKEKENISRLKASNSDSSIVFQAEIEEWVCWKYITFNENEYICLSDFRTESTFRLTTPNYRKENIKKIIDEVKSFEKCMKNVLN